MLLDNVVEYFAKDPLKVLYLVGGAGGIRYWVREWRDRIRVEIRVVSEKPYILAPEMEEGSAIVVEAENLGMNVTSIKPSVQVTAYTPKAKRIDRSASIAEMDRDLQPHKPKRLTFDIPANPDHKMLVFRSYKFTFSRGPSRVIRMWSVNHRLLGLIRYFYELFLFKVFGQFREPPA